MNNRHCKLFIGPMSKNVIDAVIQYANCNDCVLGLVASRRQVEYNGGYVMSNGSLFHYVKKKTKNVILQRDHAGPHQVIKKFDTGILSLKEDVKWFDLIHIDPFIFSKGMIEAANSTILLMEWCLEQGFEGKFEIGTEEAICPYTSYMLEQFLTRISLCDLLKYVKYVVVQSGPKLQGGKNIGFIRRARCSSMREVISKYGLEAKEHNCDYLKVSDIRLLHSLGVDAINIAPEFGAIESLLVYDKLTSDDTDKWQDLCLSGPQWRRWFRNSIPKTKRELIQTVGHYFFSDVRYRDLREKSKVTDEEIQNEIKCRIEQLLKLQQPLEQL